MKKFSLVSLAAFLLSNCMWLHGVEIIAHRGAAQDAPENTLASFKLGWEQKADADELDIHLTKDGQVVVIHDPTTKRTTGVDKKIAESTLDELRALDAGSSKGAQWSNEKIPTFAEALATVPDGKKMFIEIKCGPEVLPAMQAVLQSCGKKAEQLVIIGFGYETMKQAKKIAPQSAAYWLVGVEKEKKGQGDVSTPKPLPSVESLIAKAKEAGLDGLDLSAKFPIDAEFVGKVKGAGLKLYTWTVDDAVEAKRLAAAGVDGITTNRPGWLREQLSSGSK